MSWTPVGADNIEYLKIEYWKLLVAAMYIFVYKELEIPVVINIASAICDEWFLFVCSSEKLARDRI